jgi:PAS domain S-box-containing protein
MHRAPLSEMVADAARIAGVPLVQLLLRREGSGRARFETAALAGSAVERRAALRKQVEALLEGVPTDAGAVPRGDGPHVAPCEPGLRRLLANGAGAALRSVSIPLTSHGNTVGCLRFVTEGAPRKTELEVFQALAHQAALHLENERLRQELETQRAAYRSYQENAGEAILVIDPETGGVLEGNGKLAELTGHPQPALLKLGVGKLISHPSLAPHDLLGWLRSEKLVREDEALLRRRRGEPVPVSITAAHIQTGSRKVIHIIARDSTAERRVMGELKQAKEALSALNLAGTHLMVETDRGAIYGVIARELLRLGFHSAVLAAEQTRRGPRPPFRYAFLSFNAPLQKAAERLLGRALYELRIDPEQAPLIKRLLNEGRTIHTDKGQEAARDLFGADASPRLARMLGLKHVILAPLRYDQGISGVLAVSANQMRRGDPEAIDAFALQASIALEKARLFAELREQHQRLESEVERRTRELTLAVRALKEIDRRKDNFLANISHELRTPLVTVLGYSELLLTGRLGELSERQTDCLAVVASSARRLKSFIEELLDFSRYELTKEGLAWGEFDIVEAISQAVMSLAPRLAERDVRVRARVAHRTPRVWADKERILQVLVNLLSNAERFCGDKGRIRISAAPLEPDMVQVAVTDNGQGIPPEHLERIFDRLYQVGDSVKQREKGAGLGLGLNIVKSIVEAHGGRVAVRSWVGRGTSFRFSLPAKPPVDEAR